LEFDQTLSVEPDLADAAEAAVEAEHRDDVWPRCPGCDARRPTRCPVCRTAGTDFPLADPAFLGSPEASEDAEPHSCGCTSGGCSGDHGDGHVHEHPEPEAEGAAAPDAEPPELVALCTTCDEPFVPDHPDRCEWCGYRFPDGYEVQKEEELIEPIPARAIAVIFALVALGAALLVYFTVLV
jgi:hypothetical protein